MSKNRMLSTRFWSDSWIVDELNPLDRYLLLYLMLNERASLCGIYELPLKYIANETGIERDEVGRMLKRIEPKAFYRNGWVVLVNGIKHQNYRNSKIAAGIQREMCACPAELIELLSIPSDFDMDFSCPIDSTTDKAVEKDESSMSHTRDITPNLTKPNLTKPNSTPSAGFDKSKINKKAYAKAAQADRDQEARVIGRKVERASDSKVSSIREELTRKGILKNKA